MHATVNPAKKSPPKLKSERNGGEKHEYGFQEMEEGGLRKK